MNKADTGSDVGRQPTIAGSISTAPTGLSTAAGVHGVSTSNAPITWHAPAAPIRSTSWYVRD